MFRFGESSDEDEKTLKRKRVLHTFSDSDGEQDKESLQKNDNSQEIDPLDAFMDNLSSTAKEDSKNSQNQIQNRADIEEEDDHELLFDKIKKKENQIRTQHVKPRQPSSSNRI